MKPHLIATVLICLAVNMVTGCAPVAPGTVTPTETPVVRVNPSETMVPPVDTAAPTITSVPKPSMEVGATYYYVDGTTLVAVPGGEFQMGADGTDNLEHTVNLQDYWIYSTKVTNQQYARCEATGKCTSPDLEDNPQYSDIIHANDPVVGISYDQAAAYCSFVNGRLPTEAEWEKSARHPDGGLYPWGSAEPTCELLNFKDCAGGTTNVTDYQDGKSYYGSLGTAGNAFEWVADWYAADYYASSPVDNPAGPTNGTSRSVRSSSYASDVDQVSVASRKSEDPQNHRPDLGFRCVVEDPSYFASYCEAPLAYGSDVTAQTQPADSCPVLDIKQAPYCAGKLALTNVRFVGPTESVIDAKDCIPSENPNLFTCQSPKTTVSITAGCQVDISGNSMCPNGYTQQGDHCIASGSTGACMNGTYDSTQHCCDVDSTTTAASPVCPVGSFYSQNENACVAYPVREVVSISEEVLFARCLPVGNGGGGGDEGGNGGNSCQEPAGGCLSSVWIASKCCCSFALDGSDCP